MSNGAKYPEIRDYLLEQFGLKEEVEKYGMNHLPTRVIGTIGGLTNKMFVELAEREASSQTSISSFK